MMQHKNLTLSVTSRWCCDIFKNDCLKCSGCSCSWASKIAWRNDNASWVSMDWTMTPQKKCHFWNVHTVWWKLTEILRHFETILMTHIWCQFVGLCWQSFFFTKPTGYVRSPLDDTVNFENVFFSDSGYYKMFGPDFTICCWVLNNLFFEEYTNVWAPQKQSI